ncbi:MAG: hypothetical protein QM760_12635 [Nibricoccus sp.]
MSWINRLERRLEPYAITNLTLFIVIGQVFVLLTGMLGLIDPELLILVPSHVKAGEWWRIFSFILIPPAKGPVFIAFALYLFYLYGSALERVWGPLRFNFFLLTGWALTVGLSLIIPLAGSAYITNIFLLGLIFLAFARLNPDFELLLFFVLPVKVKWLALIEWITYGFFFATGGMGTRLAVGAAIVNFLIFFSRDIARATRQSARRGHTARLGRANDTQDSEARHTCSVCGRTDITNPQLDFRYAADDKCYCSDHLPNRKAAVPAGNNSDSPSA